MDTATIIAHNSGFYVATALQAAASMFGSDLVLVCALLGLIIAIAGPLIGFGATDSNTAASASPFQAIFAQMWAKWILLLLFCVVIFPTKNNPFGLRVNTVFIEDRENSNYDTVVNNVPFFVVAPIALTSQVGDKLTDMMETYFVSPSAFTFTYSARGLAYAIKIFQEHLDLSFPNELRPDAVNYFKNCVAPEIDNESESETFLSQTDIMAYLSGAVEYNSLSRITPICDTSDCLTSTYYSCAAARSTIDTNISNTWPNIQAYIAKKTGIGFTDGLGVVSGDETIFEDELDEVLDAVFSPGPSSGSLAIKNILLIDAFFDGITLWEKDLGETASIQYAAAIQAQRGMGMEWMQKGAFFSKLFTEIRALLECSFLVLIPLLFIFAIVRSQFAVIYTIVGMGMTLALVDPIYVLFNYFVDQKITDITYMGYTYNYINLLKIKPIFNEQLNLMNYLSTFVLGFAGFIMMVVSKGSSASHGAGSGAGQIGQSHIQSAAAEVGGHGNINWDNRSVGNQSYDNLARSNTSMHNSSARNISHDNLTADNQRSNKVDNVPSFKGIADDSLTSISVMGDAAVIAGGMADKNGNIDRPALDNLLKASKTSGQMETETLLPNMSISEKQAFDGNGGKSQIAGIKQTLGVETPTVINVGSSAQASENASLQTTGGTSISSSQQESSLAAIGTGASSEKNADATANISKGNTVSNGDSFRHLNSDGNNFTNTKGNAKQTAGGTEDNSGLTTHVGAGLNATAADLLLGGKDGSGGSGGGGSSEGKGKLDAILGMAKANAGVKATSTKQNKYSDTFQTTDAKELSDFNRNVTDSAKELSDDKTVGQRTGVSGTHRKGISAGKRKESAESNQFTSQDQNTTSGTNQDVSTRSSAMSKNYNAKAMGLGIKGDNLDKAYNSLIGNHKDPNVTKALDQIGWNNPGMPQSLRENPSSGIKQAVIGLALANALEGGLDKPENMQTVGNIASSSNNHDIQNMLQDEKNRLQNQETTETGAGDQQTQAQNNTLDRANRVVKDNDNLSQNVQQIMKKTSAAIVGQEEEISAGGYDSDGRPNSMNTLKSEGKDDINDRQQQTQQKADRASKFMGISNDIQNEPLKEKAEQGAAKTMMDGGVKLAEDVKDFKEKTEKDIAKQFAAGKKDLIENIGKFLKD